MQEADDKRAALSAIIYGDYPGVTPRDRLQALQMLNQLDERGPKPTCFCEELEQVPDEQFSAFNAPLISEFEAFDEGLDDAEVAALVRGTSTNLPRLAARVHAEVELLLRERAEPDAPEG